MTKAEKKWRNQAQTYADRIGVAGGDLWDVDDPYDLFDAAHAAFEEGRKPKDFISEIFAEDIASKGSPGRVSQPNTDQDRRQRSWQMTDSD